MSFETSKSLSRLKAEGDSKGAFQTAGFFSPCRELVSGWKGRRLEVGGSGLVGYVLHWGWQDVPMHWRRGVAGSMAPRTVAGTGGLDSPGS